MDNARLQQLENRISKLENELKDLKNSNTIPYETNLAFLGLGFQKFKSPAIYLNGIDQGSWLNDGGYMAFPPAFAKITEGEFAGFWIPLYIPPRQI